MYQKKKFKIITFIHPFCADCGGGEKVLWRMLNALMIDHRQEAQKLKIQIIVGVKDSAEEIKQKVNKVFSIDFNNFSNSVHSIEIIRVKTAYLLKPLPFGTMLFQILGQIIFGFEIITKCYSDIYYDTTGYPFSYPILYIFGSAKVFAYVHYPYISEDMINEVRQGLRGIHSRGIISKFKFMKSFKLFYYQCIKLLYKSTGSFVSMAQCNSSWTYNHMALIWNKQKLIKLFPPCTTSVYAECAQNTERRGNIIVSFAQFRPEKDHYLQVQIIERIKDIIPDVELHMIGGVRNEADSKYVNDLENSIKNKHLENHIKLIKNADLRTLKEEFKNAKIGIHTMKDEHFGITIIEMMSAGLIVITHKSAGAYYDIIPSGTNCGYLANDIYDYVNDIKTIFKGYQEMRTIRDNAINRAKEFSNEKFELIFQELFAKMLSE